MKDMMTIEDIKERISSDDVGARCEALQSMVGRLMKVLWEFPTHPEDIIGEDLYRATQFVTDDRPMGPEGDDW